MKILYLSCHKSLEHDETLLFKELGHEVDVLRNYGMRENTTDQKIIQRELDGINVIDDVTYTAPPTELKINFDISQYDVIYTMHYVDWIAQNWDAIKHKKVLYRCWQTKYQPTDALRQYREEGLIMIRYSPLTQYDSFVNNKDVVIRFYKDPDIFNNWNGKDASLMMTCQDIQSRPYHCHYDLYQTISMQFPRKLFGRGNETLGIPGGNVSYKQLIDEYKNNRVYLYLGTYPSPYSLGFIEAWMTGIPIVAIGSVLGHDNAVEVPSFIKDGVNGFCSDDVCKIITNIDMLLNDKLAAQKIGEEGRKAAIELFGKDKIKEQWKTLFDSVA